MSNDKFKDPYALEKDIRESLKWEDLFRITAKLYPQGTELLEALRAVRMAGAVLKEEKNGYVIRPIIDYKLEKSMFKDMDEYEKWKSTYLMPFKDEITRALLELTKYQKWKKVFVTLLNKEISTPRGKGVLLEVSPYGALVEVDGEKKIFGFEECEPF